MTATSALVGMARRTRGGIPGTGERFQGALSEGLGASTAQIHKRTEEVVEGNATLGAHLLALS